ncbi:hypothetical protein KIL84_003194 [Mauremys mutica]|uniref:Uncharacterized protein n=1 Tax=Mauremys mutica TaxID=74926 RepID=A0A9D3WVB0_9SAUR|nr:hypothetical protein KIL84_003194 [Mauremys mutica]
MLRKDRDPTSSKDPAMQGISSALAGWGVEGVDGSCSTQMLWGWERGTHWPVNDPMPGGWGRAGSHIPTPPLQLSTACHRPAAPQGLAADGRSLPAQELAGLLHRVLEARGLPMRACVNLWGSAHQGTGA